RLVFGPVALQGEGFYVADATREALDGYVLTNSERFGRLRGAAWYVEISAWPFGERFLRPEPGILDPRRIDPSDPLRFRTGLELLAIVSGIDARYDGSSRGGSKSAVSGSSVEIYEAGLGASVWLTRHVRFAVNYLAYLSPN